VCFGITAPPIQYSGYVYPPSVVIHWIIRAKPEVNALILTGHNHDDRYVRHDMKPQKELHTDSGMTAERRANARYNIQALSRETQDSHTGGGITFSGPGNYVFNSHTIFKALTATSQAANIEIENPYGWATINMGGATGGYIDIKSPYSGNYDLRILGGYSGDGYTGNQAWIVSGNQNSLKLMVDGASGIQRQAGIFVKSGTGENRGNVGVRTANPTMSLEVRGSGIKIGPHLFDGDSLSGATSWDRTPQHGMFIGGMFNSTGLTTIDVGLTMNSALFPENPNGVYTVDPGTGISIKSGRTVVIDSGFKWKIL
jgi:hypothetical protein